MEFYKSFVSRKFKYVIVDGDSIEIFDNNTKRMTVNSRSSVYFRRKILESCTLIEDETEIAKLTLLLL